jgi:hypothetical protein
MRCAFDSVSSSGMPTYMSNSIFSITSSHDYHERCGTAEREQSVAVDLHDHRHTGGECRGWEKMNIHVSESTTTSHHRHHGHIASVAIVRPRVVHGSNLRPPSAHTLARFDRTAADRVWRHHSTIATATL